MWQCTRTTRSAEKRRIVSGRRVWEQRKRSSKRGFTLIELLVVIAIVSILATILLPALNEAKTLANNTVCLNHASGLYRAEAMYATDYDGQLPQFPLFFYSNLRVWRASYAQSLSYGSIPVELGSALVAPEYASPGLFECPLREPYPDGISTSWVAGYNPSDDYCSPPSGSSHMKVVSAFIFRAYTTRNMSGTNSLLDADTGVLRMSEVLPGMAMVADDFNRYLHVPHEGADPTERAMNVVYGDGHGEYLPTTPNGYYTWGIYSNWGTCWYWNLALDKPAGSFSIHTDELN